MPDGQAKSSVQHLDDADVITERRSAGPATQVILPQPPSGSMGLAGLAATISNMTAVGVMFLFLFLQRADFQSMMQQMMTRIDTNQARTDATQKMLEATLQQAERDRMLMDKKFDLLIQKIELTRTATERTEKAVTEKK